MSNWKNVNNWHWTNKNCMNWAKDYLKERLVNLEIEHEGYKIETTEIIECSGDADLNQRKGKFISIIDLEVELKWEGDKPDGEKITGKIKIPELQSSGDVEFEIEVEDDPSDKDVIRKIIREQLGPLMNEKVKNFGNDMLETHSKDVYIEPSKLGTTTTSSRPITPNESITPTITPTKTTPTTTKESTKESTKGSLSKTSLGNVTTIKETVELQTSADQVYETLLDPGRVAAWTRSRPDIFRQIGTSFSLFDGNITGTILELIPNEKIVQKWRLKAWPEGHYSTVTLKFEQTTDFTRVHVTQEGIPIGEEEIVRRNWQSYYWNSIKSVFGYGFISSTINNNNNNDDNNINKSFIKNNNYKNKSKDNNNNNNKIKNNINRNSNSSSSNSNNTDSISDSKKNSKKISKKNKNNNNNRSKRKSKNSNSGNEGGINYVFVVASVLTVIVLGFAFLSRSSSTSPPTSIPSSTPSSST